MTFHPQQDTEYEIPTVVYIPETTLLSRWDPAPANSETKTVSWRGDSQSSLMSDISAVPESTATPPRAPRRSYSPPPKARKHHEVSRNSGVDIGSVPLVPVEFGSDNGKVVPLMECKSSLSSVLESQAGRPNGQVTAVFCIRREGCGSCRDHGNQLKELYEQFPHLNLFGVIKNAPIKNDAALSEFYSKHFPFPIYRDDQWDTFKFLGNRNLSIWKTLKCGKKLTKRYSDCKIKNALIGGDHFTQGGILLFDKNGMLRYVYYERYGDRLDVDALKWAIRDCEEGPGNNTLLRVERPPKLPKRHVSRDNFDKAVRRPRRRLSPAA
ncbi:family with sequence similarity 213, member [Seminavis robusta]|uniref:Family with sequence similarity 213, member n=1 Tax=Seminavis robusta TaxID=568900 RepID=A0A9N8E388_9STRA|nr:family with sequence similarity 213, member [Seminavis robusta]|eukprot:Sro510_g157220.1 family with sequence similarity 213, member (324) ;mRNA; r:22177-23148